MESKSDPVSVELPVKEGYEHPIVRDDTNGKNKYIKKSVRGLGFTPEKQERNSNGRGRYVFECKKRPRTASRRSVNQDGNEALASQTEPPCSFKAIIQVAPGKDKWRAVQDVVPHNCGFDVQPSTEVERLHASKEAYRKSSHNFLMQKNYYQQRVADLQAQEDGAAAQAKTSDRTPRRPSNKKTISQLSRSARCERRRAIAELIAPTQAHVSPELMDKACAETIRWLLLDGITRRSTPMKRRKLTAKVDAAVVMLSHVFDESSLVCRTALHQYVQNSMGTRNAGR